VFEVPVIKCLLSLAQFDALNSLIKSDVNGSINFLRAFINTQLNEMPSIAASTLYNLFLCL
jgi:hypothetical protein